MYSLGQSFASPIALLIPFAQVARHRHHHRRLPDYPQHCHVYCPVLLPRQGLLLWLLLLPQVLRKLLRLLRRSW